MLAIDLTDGVQTIKAMEFKSIRHIGLDTLKPGTKVCFYLKLF